MSRAKKAKLRHHVGGLIRNAISRLLQPLVTERAAQFYVDELEKTLTMQEIEAEFWFVQLKVPNYKIVPCKSGRAVEITVTATECDDGPVMRLLELPATVQVRTISSKSSGYRVQLYTRTGRIFARSTPSRFFSFAPAGMPIEYIEVTRELGVVGRAPLLVRVEYDRFEPAVDLVTT